MLNEPISYSVIRLDIKSFFDNIDHDILVDKLKRNSLFTTQELYLVRNLLDKTNKGVPQGLGISNYLAEIFMENFDIRISKSSYRVSYYARYVDDIIMLIPGKMTTSELDELSTEIDTVFKMYKLELNEKKTKKMYLDSKSSYEFDYLGYCFKKEKRKLVMEIAPNKMGKFFGKIDLMFEEFELSNNFQLLCERMRVFTSVNMLFKTVYILEKDMDIRYYKIPIKFGLNYDYKYASPECINRINAYLKRKIIYTSRMCRKEKKMLYSLLLKQPNENYRLIVYSKIGLMNLKSIVYRIYDGEYKWSDIMCMTRTQLISLYFANAKEHIL